MAFDVGIGRVFGSQLKVEDWSGMLGRLILMGILLSAILGAFQGGEDFVSGLSAAFATTFFGLAFVASGVFFGFIFGIPRSLQKLDSDDISRSDSYGENTNLEQISDWLTKIIVGITLVQFDLIKDLFNQITASFGPVLGANGQPIAAAIGLYFLFVGFLFSYMWTRIHMASQLQRGRSVTERLEIIEQDTHAQALVDKYLDEDQEAPVDDVPKLKAAVTAASKETRERIYNQARSFRRRQDKGRALLNESTMLQRVVPIFQALIDAPGDYYQNYLQLGYALKDKRNPDYKKAIEMLTQGINLRPIPSKSKGLVPELNRAICRIKDDEEFNDQEQSTDANIELIDADLKAGEGAFGATRPSVIKDWLRLNPKSTHSNST